jgi:hypothetical protein
VSPTRLFSAPKIRASALKPKGKALLTVATAAVLTASGLAVAALGVPAEAAPAATCPTSVGGGATVPFVEQEAECAATNGTQIGPDYTQASLASEASGRQAVQLTGQGQYVEFTLTAADN